MGPATITDNSRFNEPIIIRKAWYIRLLNWAWPPKKCAHIWIHGKCALKKDKYIKVRTCLDCGRLETIENEKIPKVV